MVQISQVFEKDNQRFAKFSATFDGQILVNYSKNRITEVTLEKETQLQQAINAMFSGKED